MLAQVNKRRCELISLHHADVSGNRNPRATKVYQYSLAGQAEVVFNTVKDCAQNFMLNADSLRALLSRNKMLLIGEKIISKEKDLMSTEIVDYLNYKNNLLCRQREPREFICENCGISYKLLLSEENFKKSFSHHHYCYACTKSGIIFRGQPKSEKQKEKLRATAARKKSQNE